MTRSGALSPSKARLRFVVLVGVNLLGALAFLWPFVLPLAPGVNENHKSDGPLILVTLLICLGAVLFVELGRGGLGPKAVALLGVLGAAMVALRLPGFVAGFSAMFIIVLVAGNSFGPGFGFLLGAVGTFASGLFIGGLGPWLPFQMVAVGWVGMGAGCLPKGSWPVRIGALAAYGFVTGYLFGAVMNLWSWPFLTTGSAVAWDPSAGAAVNLHHYATYYVATSFVWDSFRAVGDAVLVLVLGRPLLGALDRAARRMRLDVREAPPSAPTPAEPGASDSMTGCPSDPPPKTPASVVFPSAASTSARPSTPSWTRR
jgi:energy-coupling factor transport system substrate-specific component